MGRINRRALGLFAALALLFSPILALSQSTATATGPTALDRYIAKRDPVFRWNLTNTIRGEGYTTYVIRLTSQTWRSEKEVDRPIWYHWLTIVKPDNAVPGKALLYIEGGNNNEAAPARPSDRLVKLATESGGIAAELRQVPNQGLRFTDTPDKLRSEDDLIAYSRIRYMQSGDEEWLVRLAMVKSGVRALDAIQQFFASEAGGRTRVDQFVVSGGSKRAWTAWLVAATDRRVIAVMPVVIDALNSQQVTRHQFEAYGFFGDAVGDYVNHGIFPHKIGTPEYARVLAIEDPYAYRNRPALRMPKFLINASGDQFFLPDNSRFYYKDLPEEKRIRYVPNARHNLGGSDAQDSMVAFYSAILRNIPRPSYSWSRRADGALVVRSQTRPTAVTLWQANNPTARDFRLDVIGPAYQPTPLSPQPDGSYVAQVAQPARGWTAYFVELTYDIGARRPIKYTTEVTVTPDTLPFQFKDAAAKYPLKAGHRP